MYTVLYILNVCIHVERRLVELECCVGEPLASVGIWLAAACRSDVQVVHASLERHAAHQHLIALQKASHVQI